MKEPKELSPIEAAREIEYELLTQKLRNIVQELGELSIYDFGSSPSDMG